MYKWGRYYIFWYFWSYPLSKVFKWCNFKYKSKFWLGKI